MSITPDFMQAIRGWRLWEVVPSAGEPVLRSLVRRDCRWPVGQALAADCPSGRLPGPPHRHPAPAEACWCGIHAFSAQDDAVRTMGELGHGLDGPVVIGTVSLWGRVVECTRGYRGELGYPSELWVPFLTGSRRGRSSADRLVDGLRRYGVPVEPLPLTSWASTPATPLRGTA